MNKEAEEGSSLLYIDGLRAIAAVYVLLHHAVLQYYNAGTEGLQGIPKLLVYTLGQGQLFVDLFIVLSGYCLMRPVLKAGYDLRGGSIAFFKKRIIRILPTYFMAMLLSLLLIWLFIGKPTGTHWDVSLPVNLADVFTHTLLINDIFKDHAFTINHSFWSISVECRIYLAFPIMVLLWKKRGPWITIVAFFIVSVLTYQLLYFAQSISQAINLYTPGFSPYILLFLFGMLAADFVHAKSRLYALGTRLPWGVLFTASVIVFAATRVYINKTYVDAQTFSYQWINITFGLVCAVLLVLCANPGNSKLTASSLSFLSWKPLAFVGTFAYSLYLVHAPLLQILTQYLIAPLHLSRFNELLLLLALSMLIIIPLAYLFFRLCEMPLIKFGKKRIAAKELRAI